MEVEEVVYESEVKFSGCWKSELEESGVLCGCAAGCGLL